MEIEVGDRVRIREWDDMAKEFGIDEDGDIKTECFFTKDMKKHCGEIVTISCVVKDAFNIEENLGKVFTADTISPSTIIITTDWKTTTAKMGEDVGIAKCRPDDEFSFEIGAKLALERLFESKKPFKPKQGESYWYVRMDGSIRQTVNHSLLFDIMAIHCGNCFRTKEAAERNADRILREMGVK